MDAIEEIKNLKSLLDQGAITTEEFNELKKKVLSGVIDSSEPQITPQLTSQSDKNIDAKEPKKESIDSIQPGDEAETLKVNHDSRTVAEELPADEIKSIERKKIVKKIFLAAIVIGVIWLIGSVFFTPSSSDSSDPTSSSSSSSYEDNSTQQQVKKKECRYCNGTGTQICNLCGGTGVNNMGIECGCIRTYKMEILAGHTPSHEPLSWTCTFCKGTGESKY